MVVYGTRGKVIAGSAVQSLCPECGGGDHASFGVLRYFHVFWIPILPTSRKPGTECVNCKHTRVGKKEVAPELYDSIKADVFPLRRSLLYSIGLFLIAGLIASAVVSSKQEAQMEATYLQSPQAQDHYVVNLPALFPGQEFKYDYGVLKLVGMDGEMMEIQVGKYSYEKYSTAKRAIRNKETVAQDYWIESPLPLEHGRLKQLNEQRMVKAVMRP